MMKNNVTEHFQGWKRRVMRAVGALMLAGSALALTAAAASAEMSCNYPPGSNTCLTIEKQGLGYCRIIVGIDIYMSPQYAQYLKDVNGGFPFGVELLAHDHDDPADNTVALFEVPYVASQVSVAPFGLSGDFSGVAPYYGTFPCSLLNEDKGRGERDEVVARVTLYGPDYPGGFLRFHSGIIVGYW